MRIALFDYGTGNLHSLAKALAGGGNQVHIESDLAAVRQADALVLPGVGAFGAAATRVAPYVDGLRAALAAGLPCLGICIGMQLLFESSEEGAGAGIGFLPGRVRRLRVPRVPHMGWNAVETTMDPLFGDSSELIAYFANSYVAEPSEESCEIGWTEYAGDRFPSAVRKGRTWGVQFHPEKSADAGLALLRNFLVEAAR
jgi:glutamine amidotransferase